MLTGPFILNPKDIFLCDILYTLFVPLYSIHYEIFPQQEFQPSKTTYLKSSAWAHSTPSNNIPSSPQSLGNPCDFGSFSFVPTSTFLVSSSEEGALCHFVGLPVKIAENRSTVHKFRLIWKNATPPKAVRPIGIAIADILSWFQS